MTRRRDEHLIDDDAKSERRGDRETGVVGARLASQAVQDLAAAQLRHYWYHELWLLRPRSRETSRCMLRYVGMKDRGGYQELNGLLFPLERTVNRAVHRMREADLCDLSRRTRRLSELPARGSSSRRPADPPARTRRG